MGPAIRRAWVGTEEETSGGLAGASASCLALSAMVLVLGLGVLV